ncbi:hypothetical protein H0H93_015729, partial [Arthromyces matolae]
FFWRVGRQHGEMNLEEKDEMEEKGKLAETLGWGVDLNQDGTRLVTWDVAVACLGISAKYHRDFLHPQLPLYADELRKLHPEEEGMGFEDLEVNPIQLQIVANYLINFQAAHRDVLAVLEFRLGDTPDGLLIELWEGVEIIKKVLGGCVEGTCAAEAEWNWNRVQRETWVSLFRAVCEPDVLAFPLSILTTCALLNALQVVLERRYEDATPWFVYEVCASAIPGPPVES